MIEWLMMRRWSPYVVGAGIGVLSWVAFLVSGRALGGSAAFAQTAGMIERVLRGPKALEKPYYKKIAPLFDWYWTLLIGVFIGALVSAWISGDIKPIWTGEIWAGSFGTAVVPRVVVAFVGGVLMAFGARWAGGCTSGHGISGSLQLSVASWLAVMCFFAGGVGVAMVIFKVIGN
jgi:uncharacterized membrane protein YedE/YeeE